MVLMLLNRARQVVTTGVQVLQHRLRSWTKPSIPSLTVGSIHDLARSKPQLVIENALLRQQLIVLNRSVKRPHLSNSDRSLMVLLASHVRIWRSALLIVQPDTVLRWHRQGCRLF